MGGGVSRDWWCCTGDDVARFSCQRKVVQAVPATFVDKGGAEQLLYDIVGG